MRRTSDEALLFMLIGLSLIGLALHRTVTVLSVERLTLDVTMPVQRTVDGVVDRVHDMVDTVRHLDTLQAENEALKELVDQLMIENAKLKDETRELRFLREELKFSRANTFYDIQAAEILGGQVVGYDANAPLSSIVIDLGTEDGISKGMPVTRAGALIGRIVQAGAHASRVLLITDATSRVNARIQSSGVTGIVRGSIDGTLHMTHIPPDAEVKPGDIVITSGYGGHFPRRLAIGQVIRVHKRDVDPFQTADLQPAADFNALEIVSVITDFQPVAYDDVR